MAWVFALAGLVIVAAVFSEWREDRRWDRSWSDWCKTQDAPGWPLRFHLWGWWR